MPIYYRLTSNQLSDKINKDTDFAANIKTLSAKALADTLKKNTAEAAKARTKRKYNFNDPEDFIEKVLKDKDLPKAWWIAVVKNVKCLALH